MMKSNCWLPRLYWLRSDWQTSTNWLFKSSKHLLVLFFFRSKVITSDPSNTLSCAFSSTNTPNPTIHKHCNLYSNSLQIHNTMLTSNWRVIFSTPVSTGATHRCVKRDLVLTSARETYTCVIWMTAQTHHWLRRLGIAWVLLRVSGGGGGVRGLGLRRGLAGGGAAVGHGQLTQVGGVWGENWGTLATVHTSFSWERERQKDRVTFCPVSPYSSHSLWSNKWRLKVMTLAVPIE